MTQDLIGDESELLARALNTGVAKKLRADVFETGVPLDRPPADAVARVRDVLAELGTPIDEQQTGDSYRLRAMIGAGSMNLNPTVVTVTLTPGEARVRGVAKEGLIKQRAGRKAAERVADQLR